MNPQPGFEQDLASIRKLMERSVKFMSLSGLSGVLAGVYALSGAAFAYFSILPSGSSLQVSDEILGAPGVLSGLMVIALVVLVASLATGFMLSARKASRLGVNVWDDTGRRLVVNLAIPLVTGGVFILLLLWSGYLELLAPACLIFYGLALVNASPNLVDEVRFLGFSEIVLGLMGTAMPGIGLFLWAAGFGLLHIVYGSVLYRKYEV
jgi:hypothetical protein